MDPATAQAIKSGTAAGVSAGAGATTSYLDNKYNKKALNEYIKQQDKLQSSISGMASGRENQVTQAYSPYTAGLAGNVANYYDTLKNANYDKFNVTAPGAYQGKSVNELTTEMMNPETAQLEQAASNAVQASSANAGKLYSGINAKNIANMTAQVRANEYDKARSVAQAQDQANRQEWQNQFQNQVAASNVNKSNYQQGITNLGDLYTAQSGAFATQQGELGNIRSASDQAMLQSQSEEAAARAQKAGTKSGFAAALSGGLQGLASALK